MDINEELVKLEQMNSALSEAILNNDYAAQYAALRAIKGDENGSEQSE